MESLKCKVKSRIKNSKLKTQNYIIFSSMPLVLCLLASCSATYSLYSTNILYGKSALEQGKYEDARQYFHDASKAIRDSKSVAYLASAEYKVNNLDSAEKLIREVEKDGDKTFDYLRIAGYKALILLKKGSGEGLHALKEYIDTYKCSEPIHTLYDIEAMWEKKEIRIDELEKLIDEQIKIYEDDIDLYITTGVGFLGAKYQRGGSVE